LRGTPFDLADNDLTHRVRGTQTSVGAYLGFDVLRYRALTTNLRAEYVATEFTLSEADQLPSFARTEASFYRISRSTSGPGITLSQEYDIPLFAGEGGQLALGLRTEIGYLFQLREDAHWSYLNSQGQPDGPGISGGPKLNTRGLHVGFQIGIPMYVY
jgi:hypothetical protein